ncbi:nitroreductase [bacterium]|nr:MAG: nitroreductase [bacterium]
MNRRKFIGISGGALLAGGTTSYWLSDRNNLSREDIQAEDDHSSSLQADEREILFLASLAPSGHNTQPWFVRSLEPYHWIIGNDRSRWLPAVAPTQRETMLSIGAFLQNLEYAASSLGYICNWNLLATTSQAEQVMEVKLAKKALTPTFDSTKIVKRRTVRSHFSSESLRKEDVEHLLGLEEQWVYYLPSGSKESQFINDQTLEANRLQSSRNAAQQELASWTRFASRDAEKHRDGLTTASMEIEGVSGWVVRNFYGKSDVMKPGFRQKNIDNIQKEVAGSAGWIVITSRNDSVEELLETGKRMERVFLKVREKNIAIHPMTQILEETSTQKIVQQSVGIVEPIQFLLRTGYVNQYPPPVSLRRPVDWFMRK